MVSFHPSAVNFSSPWLIPLNPSFTLQPCVYPELIVTWKDQLRRGRSAICSRSCYLILYYGWKCDLLWLKQRQLSVGLTHLSSPLISTCGLQQTREWVAACRRWWFHVFGVSFQRLSLGPPSMQLLSCPIFQTPLKLFTLSSDTDEQSVLAWLKDPLDWAAGILASDYDSLHACKKS